MNALTGKYLSEALIFESTINNMATDCSLNYEFSTWKFQVEDMLRTCSVHKMFWMSKQKQKKPIWVTCSQPWNFHVLNLFNEQSFVILWVSWYKNKCFWKRFTCKGNKKVFCELSYVAPWIKVNLIQKACTKCFAGSPIKI